MSLSSSFQLFRSCAASSSSRLTRPTLRSVPGRLAQTRRHYSEKNGSKPEQEQSKAAPDAEDKYAKECEEKLKTKESEVVDLKGRLQYLHADFLNLQRNSAKEKEQTRDFAISRFAGDLLETVDVLAIALKSIPHAALSPPPHASKSQTPDAETSSPTPPPEPLAKPHSDYLQELHTGVEMTHRLLLQTLFKYHIKPFDPTGDPFDPNHHEALYQAPVPGKEPGTVIDCQKVGYKIKDRVLRAAQVGVAQGSP